MRKPQYGKRALRGYSNRATGEAPGELSKDGRHLVKAIGLEVEKVSKARAGKLELRETESVDHAQRMANAILIQTLNEVGLDARTVAFKLKEAIDLCFKSGKVIKDPSDPEGKRMLDVPDLRSLKDLLALWGSWMKVGRVGGIQQQNNFLFGPNSGLDDSQRQRVAGIVERIEAETKRRGLSDVPEGSAEPKDAEALRGVVEPDGEPQTPD